MNPRHSYQLAFADLHASAHGSALAVQAADYGNMGEETILYPYAFDMNGEVRHINQSLDGTGHKYICINCREPMSAVKPRRRQRHFRHKGQVCSRSDYIHNLGVINLYKRANQAIAEGKQLLSKWMCRSCKCFHDRDLVRNAQKVRMETNIRENDIWIRPDIQFLDGVGRVIRTAEIVNTHNPEAAVIEYSQTSEVPVDIFAARTMEEAENLGTEPLEAEKTYGLVCPCKRKDDPPCSWKNQHKDHQGVCLICEECNQCRAKRGIRQRHIICSECHHHFLGYGTSADDSGFGYTIDFSDGRDKTYTCPQCGYHSWRELHIGHRGVCIEHEECNECRGEYGDGYVHLVCSNCQVHFSSRNYYKNCYCCMWALKRNRPTCPDSGTWHQHCKLCGDRMNSEKAGMYEICYRCYARSR